MSTDRNFVDYVVEQADLGDALQFRKMFGECALHHAGKVVAFACGNSLFIKPGSALQTLAPDLPQSAPFPGAKVYSVADELLDDPDALRSLLLATSAALPLPKKKTKKEQPPRAS